LCVLQFIADGMLGKLTRWLRMLGHDVCYHRATEDNQLIELAKSEGRVLLTRDKELYERAVGQGVEATFVEDVDEVGQLASLAGRFSFGLDVDFSVSRCPKCNGMLRVVSKESVMGEIPELTGLYYDEFWRCVGCGKVYWRGSHWRRIEKTLDEARAMLEGR
jgi:uncharacterized protein with PIN domain